MPESAGRDESTRSGTPRSTTERLWSAALVVATALLFHRVLWFGFINYDDPALLFDNPRVNSGLSLANLAWAFTSTDRLQWAPLTWITHMIDFEVFGSNAGGHHFTSVLFHLFNTIALLAFLRRATGDFYRSAFVAALFALHPLHVEPVAWLSARKDLVSTALLLTALLAYLRFARRPRWSSYLVVLSAYTGSLMAKPMYVTLPLVLLLLDRWPLRRIGAPEEGGPASGSRRLAPVLWEKVPLVGLAALFSGVAYFTQAKADAVVGFTRDQAWARASGVLVGYAMYVWKAVWPAKLAVVYPRAPLSAGVVVTALLFLAAVSVLVVRGGRKRPYLLLGWGWFLVTLLPVIGIVQIGSAWLADKFTYVPLVGLFVMVAWGVPDLLSGVFGPRGRRRAVASAVAVVLTLCAARSWAYVAAWSDSITLYTAALRVTEKNFVVLGNLAFAHQQAGRLEQALEYYHEAIRAEPRYEIAHASIGFIWLYAVGDCVRARPYLATAVQLNPRYGQAASALAYCSRR